MFNDLDDNVIDFSEDRSPIWFSVQGEKYSFVPALNTSEMQEVISLSETDSSNDDFDIEQQMARYSRLFAICLGEEQGARFVSQMQTSNPAKKVTIFQAVKVIKFMMEKQSARPLE